MDFGWVSTIELQHWKRIYVGSLQVLVSTFVLGKPIQLMEFNLIDGQLCN